MKKGAKKFRKIIFFLILLLIAYFVFIKKEEPKKIINILPEATTNEDTDKSFFEEITNSEIPVPDQSAVAKLKDGYGEFQIEETTVEGIIKIENIYTIEEIGGEKNLFGIATVSPGGSGVFEYLVWLKTNDGKTELISSIFIGDRIAIDKISTTKIDTETKITLETRERKEDEPMTEEPTVQVTRVFETKENTLIEK